MTMTRDAFDVTGRRASQISHRLEILRSSPTGRRPSRVSAYIAKRSLMKEDFQGSDRTLVASSLDSNNSSRSNIHTSASSSYYTNSSTDVAGSEKAEDDADLDEDDDADSREKPEELETDRGMWEKKFHYVFLSFGVVFGVRNILSFPALAMEHGGGAFLFTYIMLTFGVGLPIVYLEVSLGQYARGGVVKTWRILSLAKGISVCSLLLTLVRASYSSTPVVWSLYYLYSAIVGSLPGQSSTPTDLIPTPEIVHLNQTANLSAIYHRQIFNASSLFLRTTLELTDSISKIGHVVPHMVAALLLVWAMVFSLSALGPRLIGKISVCFTVIPSILIAIIFVAVCTMPGSVLGLQSLLNPRWHHLADFKPWLDVLDFVLSSLGCGTGVLITLSGHCNFHGNTFRSAISLTVMSVIMTFISGCLMFSSLGAESRLAGIHMLQDNMTRLSDVELGFVLLPTVMTDLPYPNLWRTIFYLALLLLGVVHATLMVYNLQQGVIDLTHLEKASLNWRTGILGSVVAVLMALNIFTTAQNGLHIFRLLQLSVGRLSLPLVCVAQCLTVGWGYGARRFAGRITEMTGRNKSFLWKLLWRWGCPVFLSLVTIASLLTVNILHDLPQKDRSKTWLHGFAWSLSFFVLMPGITMAVASLFSVRGTLKQRLKQLRATPSTWGPGHPEHEPQADLPDYVICQPDPFRPANALAMLTANLYLPNIVNFVNMRSSPTPVQEPVPAFMSDVATLTSSEDDNSMGSPSSKESFFSRCQATVSCLSHVVGLGNVVRFPYLAYRNGGGAFLVAYFTVLVTCGIPLVVIETAIGQFSNFGPISVWRAVPVFKGVGYSMVIVSLVTSVYYSVITSWTMFYLATSLTSVMPWQDCSNNWNTNSCRPNDLTIKLCHLYNETVIDSETGQPAGCGSDDPTCVPTNGSLHSGCSDLTVPNVNAGHNNGTVSPSDEYFYLGVLKVSESWNQVGELRWQLVLCLLLTWAVVTLFLAKCFKPGKKVTYLILMLTCSLLVVLLIRTSSLVGGHEGLNLLFTPDWGRLTHGHVWRDAVSQVFFSLSLGTGTLIIMGTYNKFNNDLFREAILLCVMDGVVSLLSSLVIFAVVGVIAHAAGLAIDEAARADLGLTFVAVSSAALQLPWPLFWTILVFLMLVLLGVFTCVSAMATAIASLMDIFSPALKKQRVWLTVCLCSGAAVLSLPMIVQAGFYVIDIIDTHVSGLPQACVGGMVCIAFAWVYGLSQFSRDIKRMTNSSVGCTWKVLWLLICPCITAMLIFSSLASLTSENNDLKHPWWATTIGLVMWLLLLVPIFAGIIHEMSRHKAKGFMERFRKACQPKKEWGATLNRSTSVVEYYPTVHTHLGLDISRDGLNTIAGTKKVKKPLDLRHKAILNHGYSNPQCDMSSAGSLDKLGKQKRYPMFITNGDFQDMIVVKRANKAVLTCDVSTQTDSVLVDSKLCRQRSQPAVHVTKPVVILTRASSWHHLGGQPAILQVQPKLTGSAKSTPEKTKPSVVDTPRRRRPGQSVAPNICLLITQEETQTGQEKPVVHQIRFQTLPEVTLVDPSDHFPNSVVSKMHHKASTASEGDASLVDSSQYIHGCDSSNEDTHAEPRQVSMVISHSQPNIYTRRRPKFRESHSVTKGGRSKSVDETPANTRRHYDRYGPSEGVDNLSFNARPRSGSEAGRPAKEIIRSWLHDHRGSFHGSVDRPGRRASHVIMEEDVQENEEDKFDIDSRLQFIQSEAEIIKM